MLDLAKIDYLYHGTISKIDRIDVTYGKNYKDFGKGFYMALNIKQASNMMESKYKKAIARGNIYAKKYLYKIKLDIDFLKLCSIKMFDEINIEWLDFVLKCRLKGGTPHDYDVVIGPTADDDTITCIKAYNMGIYGDISDVRTKEILLNRLKGNVLGIQVFVGKQEIANKLIKEIVEIR